jgi:hypothetical protein
MLFIRQTFCFVYEKVNYIRIICRGTIITLSCLVSLANSLKLPHIYEDIFFFIYMYASIKITRNWKKISFKFELEETV